MKLFQTLIESRKRRTSWSTQIIIALVIHIIVISTAINATSLTSIINPIVEDTSVVFLEPAKIEQKTITVQSPTINLSSAPGFQTIDIVKEIPTDIPPIDLSQSITKTIDWSGKGREGGFGQDSSVITVQSTDSTFTEATVDEPVQVIHMATPHYPPIMQQAGIAGRVNVQYVVLVDGTIEKFTILSSTNSAFNLAAQSAIESSTFRPARIKNIPVKQLVQQSIVFKIQ